MDIIKRLSRTAIYMAITAGMTACIDFGDDHSASQSNAQISLKQNQSESELTSYLTSQYQRVMTFDDKIYAPETEVDSNTTDSGDQAAFSGTNLQVDGVDEGDIWKYNGDTFFVIKPEQWDYSSTEEQICYEPSANSEVSLSVEPYCYWQPQLLSEPKLRIVKNTKEELASVSLPDIYPNELYLNDDQLLVIGNRRDNKQDWQDFSTWNNGRVDIHSFDVSDPSDPQPGLKSMMDGYLVQSRRIGNELIMVTRYTPSIPGIINYPTTNQQVNQNKKILSGLSVSDLLPNIVVNGVSKKMVTAEECYLIQGSSDGWGSPALSIITRFNIENGAYKSTCMAGDVEGIYMSQENVYLFNTSYWVFDQLSNPHPMSWQDGNTHIHKFNISQNTTYSGSNLIEGRLGWRGQRNFRLGEIQDGSLAVVTDGQSNKLTVLKDKDDAWQKIAQIPNEAQPASIGKPNESIYSVRFMQNRAYIVTFLQIDPLYVVDLSDSSNPIILGELEIPGFSDYLHPVGNDLLLGIGHDVKNINGRTEVQGVKVSLFDVSDMTSPQELGNQIIGNKYSHTAVSYNHHAFSGIQQDDAYRFTLPISVYDTQSSSNSYYDWTYTGLHLFEVKDRALIFSGAMKTDINDGTLKYENWNTRRGLIQGNEVYHLSGSDLYQAKWETPDTLSMKF